MNIFEYKPVLNYIFDDISTINNIPKNELTEKERQYFLYNGSDLNDKLNLYIDNIDKVISEISEKILHVAAPINTLSIDPNLSDIIKLYSGGSLILENGLIPFSFIQESSNNPSLYLIKRAWDDYSSGINGDLLSELYPQTEKIRKILINLQEVLDKTVNYRYNIDNGFSIKENQYFYFESYIKEKEDLSSAIKNKDVKKINLLRKSISIKESKINHDLKICKEINNLLPKINKNLRMLKDCIGPQYDEYIQTINARADEIRNSLNFSNDAAAATIYSAFKKYKTKSEEIEATMQTVLSDKLVDGIKKSFIEKARIYLDAGINQISEISYLNSEINETTLDILINGLEQIRKEYEQSSILFFDVEEASTNKLFEELILLYKKNDARSIYQKVT